MLRSNFFTFLWYKAAALTPILGKEMNEARINGWVVFVCCSTSKERPFPTIKITQLLARDRQFLPNLYDYPKSFKPGPYGNWDQFYAHTPFWVGFFRTLHYIFSLFSSSKEGLKSKNQIFKKVSFNFGSDSVQKIMQYLSWLKYNAICKIKHLLLTISFVKSRFSNLINVLQVCNWLLWISSLMQGRSSSRFRPQQE